MTTPTLADVWAVVASSLADEAVPIAGWVDGHVAPALPAPWRPARIVFALPAARVASLRHWRHEAEVWDARLQLQVVAVEASVVARGALVGEPTVDGWARGTALAGGVDALARGFDGGWMAGSPVGFDAVDAWLAAARAAAADPMGERRPL